MISLLCLHLFEKHGKFHLNFSQEKHCSKSYYHFHLKSKKVSINIKIFKKKKYYYYFLLNNIRNAITHLFLNNHHIRLKTHRKPPVHFRDCCHKNLGAIYE